MTMNRRQMLALAAAVPLAAKMKNVPVGLELYSVRNELSKDLFGTVKAVAQMGYQGVEFYSPYFAWTTDYAKQVRTLLDDLGIKCFSTHNGPNAFSGDGVAKAVELNTILGSRFVVMASAGRVTTIDGWKKVAETLTASVDAFKKAKMQPGFHNHQVEFRELEGQKPIEVLAKNTPKDVVLQLDVGTCVETGNDPAAWIKANPGRLRSIHLKEWSKEKGYHVNFGDGAAPWKAIFEAAEKSGGVEHYLIEQEGADAPPMTTVAQCLANFKKLRA